MKNAEKARCFWVGDDPLMQAYHDEEWGAPVHDDARHFEMLTLEGAQAGLSWATILKRREGYRRAFAAFDAAIVAAYDEAKIEALLQDTGIIRHRGKIESTVQNATVFLAIAEAFGSFDAYIWRFVDGTPRINHPRSAGDMDSQTPLSRSISKDLKKRGMRFVGPTTVYAYLQAAGLVVDHTVECFLHKEAHPDFV